MQEKKEREEKFKWEFERGILSVQENKEAKTRHGGRTGVKHEGILRGQEEDREK